MRKLAVLTVLAIAPLAFADAKPVAKKKISKVSKVSTPPDDEDSYADPADKKRKLLPAAPDANANYDAWKKKLTATQRAQVERFCRYDRPADYEPHCGGIGLYRIPSPPRMTHAGVTQAHYNAWKASLNRAQRASFEHLCNQEIYGYTELCGGTPLVVAFDHQAVEFTPTSTFATDWPTAATPWLALDRDGDGAITSGAELFGDSTLIGTRTAKHGFEALASLDTNGDGRIDRADPMFASLLLWADRDGDRTSSPAELTRASSVIDSIELGYTIQARCDARLNCERERAIVHYAGRTGSVVDVYLHHR